MVVRKFSISLSCEQEVWRDAPTSRLSWPWSITSRWKSSLVATCLMKETSTLPLLIVVSAAALGVVKRGDQNSSRRRQTTHAQIWLHSKDRAELDEIDVFSSGAKAAARKTNKPTSFGLHPAKAQHRASEGSPEERSGQRSHVLPQGRAGPNHGLQSAAAPDAPAARQWHIGRAHLGKPRLFDLSTRQEPIVNRLNNLTQPKQPQVP